ncbi:hypothetical protein BGY98DRAFT_1096471 [Russula aff. rugulosa BPL654]|nr:hypothetical protein BGY98DRAFT_1096471 [Russula aff. rugulosa BPL654]
MSSSDNLPHTGSPQSSPAPLSGRSSLSALSTGTTRPESWDQRPSTGSSSSNTMWQSTSTTARRAATGVPSASTSQEDLTRHWSFTAFEWVVHDVRKLRDFVEGRTPEDAVDGRGGPDRDDFGVLRESPTLGDGKYKLEIEGSLSARTPIDAEATSTHTLSLYVTCLMLDDPNAEYEISASMLAAIKCQDDRVGERGARADWAWDTWQTEWTFRQDNEVWQCAMPSLSSLLENPRIHRTDSLVICIQIHTPTGPFFPQHPSAYYVARDLLEGLEASLDNSNTGDVQFICLEKATREYHKFQPLQPHRIPPILRASIPLRHHIPSVHRGSLLESVSDYFASMLSSAFAETVPSGERKIHTVVVEEADFVTIYWLLKWVYANWLLFQEDDDPRSAVEGVGAGWSVRWLSARGTAGEWDWKTFSNNSAMDDDIVSAASGESAHSVVEGRGSGSSQGKSTFSSGQSASLVMRNAVQRSASSSKVPPPSSTLRSTSSVVSRRGTVPTPVTQAIRSPYANSPQRPRTRASAAPSSGDPHSHPTSTPPPASALSVYQIAHRYELPGLATLALEHMMTTITPQSCFALLLASVVWDELHSLVEDFVVERWIEVQASEEFERGCAEVAAGEWGVDGGKTLMALFRRLRSPAPSSYTRG